MNKLSLLGLTVALAVCLLASGSQARTVQHDTGRALIDEITGVEVEHVSVPRLATGLFRPSSLLPFFFFFLTVVLLSSTPMP